MKIPVNIGAVSGGKYHGTWSGEAPQRTPWMMLASIGGTAAIALALFIPDALPLLPAWTATSAEPSADVAFGRALAMPLSAMQGEAQMPWNDGTDPGEIAPMYETVQRVSAAKTAAASVSGRAPRTFRLPARAESMPATRALAQPFPVARATAALTVDALPRTAAFADQR